MLDATAATNNLLALTYLHLGEHYMATQSIYKAFEQDNSDPIIICNKEIFDWIYAMEHSELIHSKYPSKS